jgi:phage-related protein
LLLVQFLLSVTTIKIGDQNDENKNHIRTMYTRDKGWRLFGWRLPYKYFLLEQII